jgi:hypothetical protein
MESGRILIGRGRRHRVRWHHLDGLRGVPCASDSHGDHTMQDVIVGLIALGCFIHLIAAVLRPEKF